MSGRNPLLYCILKLITMRNPQSYPNITSITLQEDIINVDNSNIEPYTSKGLGKQ